MGQQIKSDDTDFMRPEDVISRTADRTREMKDSAVESTKDVYNRASDATKDAYNRASESISNAASSVKDGMNTVATKVSDGAQYLADQGLNDLNAEVSEMIRRRPLQALGVGFGLGVLLGCALSRR